MRADRLDVAPRAVLVLVPVGTVVDPRYFRPGRNRTELFRIGG
jgi:hypothetical protein